MKDAGDGGTSQYRDYLSAAYRPTVPDSSRCSARPVSTVVWS